MSELRSDTLEIGAIIRLLTKGLIGQAVSRLRALQDQTMRGAHSNPPMRVKQRRGGDITFEIAGVMSHEAHAILYRHAEDGKQYKHDFENRTSLLALKRGGARHDVLITSPDGWPIWQDF